MSIEKIIITPAVDKDADFIHQCVVEFYSQNPYEIKTISDEKLKQAIAKLLKTDNNYYFIIKYDKQPVGLLQVMKTGKNRAEIILIYIQKEYRHKGIGEYSMKYILQWLEKKNIKHIKTEVNIHNKISQSFFQSLGFTKHSLIYTKDID